MKVEIKRSELEAVKEKLKVDRGFFFSPCKECIENDMSSCGVEEICAIKKRYEQLWQIYKVLDSFDIINNYRQLFKATEELEKAKEYYFKTNAELEEKLSKLFIIED